MYNNCISKLLKHMQCEVNSRMRHKMVSTEVQASSEVLQKVCTLKSRNVCSVEWRYVWTWNDGWNWIGPCWRSRKILTTSSHSSCRILIQDLFR